MTSIYSNEQAKLFTDTQKQIKLDRTETLKKRQAEAEERAEAKRMNADLNQWILEDLGVEL